MTSCFCLECLDVVTPVAITEWRHPDGGMRRVQEWEDSYGDACPNGCGATSENGGLVPVEVVREQLRKRA